MKFNMMLKTGLPEGAVRQKMAMEGVGDSDIGRFFGDAPPTKQKDGGASGGDEVLGNSLV